MKTTLSVRLLAAVAAFVAVPMAGAVSGECTAKSGPGTAALLELYTSEGCDSCPPADEWLRKVPAAGLDAGAVVPLALHVDYWDYIGWKDPFASAAFGARQRELAAINRGRVVYTPQVVLAGRDYRGWANRGRFGADVRAINAAPARAEIDLALRGAAAGGPEVRAVASVPRKDDRIDTALYVALFESGLSNRVTAGENRGVTLKHDFVVREWWGPIALDGSGGATLVRTSTRMIANGGAVAFVQSRRTGEVLQALALPACKG